MSRKEAKRARIDWAKCPTVFVSIPPCPHCGAFSFEKVRTEANGDGSRTRKTICLACNEPFKISVEQLPALGNDVYWPCDTDE